jgi:molybdopterin synthase catalytic subunit
MSTRPARKEAQSPGREAVRVTVRLFASVRERAGASSLIVPVARGGTVAQALEAASKAAPGEWRLPSKVMLAVNGEYATEKTELSEGDEVAVIPPVSGGADAEPLIVITDRALETEQLVEAVRSDSDGAIVTFLGVTRDRNEGRRVLYLEYEAYQPMAERKIAEIFGEMKSRWTIGRAAVAHRTGRVDIGEMSMALAVSAPHRRPAFEAALYFVDRLKEVVPIWKKEYFEGGDMWIGETPGKAAPAARPRP